jgi:hypothetical protein
MAQGGGGYFLVRGGWAEEMKGREERG